MASSSALLILLLFFVAAATATAAERFRVGDRQGWRQPDHSHADLYDRWAASIRFHVGDSIYFEYTNDSAWVVTKAEYYHCNATDPIEAFDDGATAYVLRKPGPLYFVSGNAEHCKNGQRLVLAVVQVTASHPPKNPPPPPPAPTAGRPHKPAPPAPPPPQPSPAGWPTPVSVVLAAALAAVVVAFVQISPSWS